MGYVASSGSLSSTRDVWVSVVIPAYNEARRIGPTLEAWTRLAAGRPPASPTVEIVVVDDGSADATAAVVRDVAARIPCVRLIRLDRNRGKGYAIRAGLMAASGRFVCYTDADLPVDPSALPKFVAALGEVPAEVAIANRTIIGLTPDVPVRRALASIVFRWLVRGLVLPEIADSQCGFKVFDRAAITPLLPLLTMDGFAVDVELLRLALDADLRVAEIPVRVVHREGSTVRLWHDVLPMALDLLRIAVRRRLLLRQIRRARWANVS